eukprot:NODE_703_length_1497_cov_142.032459_g546_i1.p1 GENE.NODE_703_length_1497_cov_142.032459_g546_i1~~NODE_703_length_1497_cov_142.032459_g546_i1.p1  ORF type:complete len:439 (-),score=95.50 NODE_703_length_1497_cov_142.032459_g546_i1:67-1383(-)
MAVWVVVTEAGTSAVVGCGGGGGGGWPRREHFACLNPLSSQCTGMPTPVPRRIFAYVRRNWLAYLDTSVWWWMHRRGLLLVSEFDGSRMLGPDEDVGDCGGWEDAACHFRLLMDTARNDAFRRGLRWVCPGQQGLDVGTGPLAYLALVSLAEGASGVRCLEANPSGAAAARKLVSGAHDARVEATHSANAAPNGEKLAFVVHEVLGHVASEEGAARALADVRQRLAPDASFVPHAATTYCPVWRPQAKEGLLLGLVVAMASTAALVLPFGVLVAALVAVGGGWTGGLVGLLASVVTMMLVCMYWRRPQEEGVRFEVYNFPQSLVLSSPCAAEKLVFGETATANNRAEWVVAAPRAPVRGVVLSMRVAFDAKSSVVLDTSRTPTNWGSVYIPLLPGAKLLSPTDEVKIGFRCDDDGKSLKYEVWLDINQQLYQHQWTIT